MPDSASTASYTVDWSGQGYEELAQQMREFLNLKRQVDAELRRGLAHGPQPSGIVGTAGQALVSGQRQGEYAQQQVMAQESQRRVAESRRQAQDEQTYSRAERQAKQADSQAEREANAYTRRLKTQQAQEERARGQSDRQARQQERQASQAAERTANNTPNVFAGISNAGLKTDKEWDEYHAAIGERYKTALKNNEDLNSADQRILGNSRTLAGMSEKAAKGGFMSRIINTIGWAPGVPQAAYMGSMALGEMGLGLGPVGVAAGLGLGGMAALGMGVVNTTASQLMMARLLAGISAGGSGAVATPADMALASNVGNIGRGFGLSAADTYKLVPTAAQYNLGKPGTIAGVVAGGLNRAAEGQLTNEQGVQLQSLVTSRNGGDAAATAREFLALNAAIVQVGADTHTVYSDILREGQALRTGTDLTGFAVLDKALQGTGLTASDIIGGGTTSTGVQRLSQAAMLGMSESDFTALQQSPQAFARRLQGYTRGLMQQTGSQSATEAVLTQAGFIQGGSNADQVLQQILAGNFQGTAPKFAGPPVPPSIANQAVQQETIANMTVSTLSLPLMARIGMGAGTAMQGLTNLVNNPGGTIMPDLNLLKQSEALANQDVNTNPALAGLQASGLGGIAFAIQTVRHMIDITVKDAAGNTLGTAQTTVGGSSTQTPTTTPGPGPTPNTTIKAPAIPNRTNANGR